MDSQDILNTAYYEMESHRESLLVEGIQRRLDVEVKQQEFLVTPRTSSPKPSHMRPMLLSPGDHLDGYSYLEFARRLIETEPEPLSVGDEVHLEEKRMISGKIVMPKKPISYKRKLTEEDFRQLISGAKGMMYCAGTGALIQRLTVDHAGLRSQFEGCTRF